MIVILKRSWSCAIYWLLHGFNQGSGTCGHSIYIVYTCTSAPVQILWVGSWINIYLSYYGAVFISHLEKLRLHSHQLFRDESYIFSEEFLTRSETQKCLVRRDNTTVIQYINKQGGTNSGQVYLLTWKLWKLAISIQNIKIIKAAHFTINLNILANVVSRKRVMETKLSFNRTAVAQIFQRWGYPAVELLR